MQGLDYPVYVLLMLIASTVYTLMCYGWSAKANSAKDVFIYGTLCGVSVTLLNVMCFRLIGM